MNHPNQDITIKTDKLLDAISYAEQHGANQQNISKLGTVRSLTGKIKDGDLDAKHELKGLFLPKADISSPDTDISRLDVTLNGVDGSFPLQKYIDDLVQAVERFQGHPDR